MVDRVDSRTTSSASAAGEAKMAESKGALIAKSFKKHTGRTKEKILQNFGKVDRTSDDIFDEHLQNFNRQQAQATRLQKEFNNYIRCIRAAQVASKSLWDAVAEVYETSWQGRDLVVSNTQSLDVLWQDYSHKLADQVLIPLNTYQAQFPEMKKKIDKRGRKLVDFDSQRHSLQGLTNSTGQGKQRNEMRLARAKESLEEARRTYEILNSELHDELPALHDSRVLFLVTHLQTLFASEQLFHTETSKVFTELESIVDKLATDCQRGAYTPKKPKSSPQSPKSPLSNNSSNNANNSLPASPTSGATTDNLPPGVLYRVKSTYKYNREDVDELSFEIGEIIRVIEYEDPEEQDDCLQEEGWLMGVKESTGEKGMFPANFTRPI